MGTWHSSGHWTAGLPQGKWGWGRVLQAVPGVLAPPAAILLWVGAWVWGILGTFPPGAGSQGDGTAALALLAMLPGDAPRGPGGCGALAIQGHRMWFAGMQDLVIPVPHLGLGTPSPVSACILGASLGKGWQGAGVAGAVQAWADLCPAD